MRHFGRGGFANAGGDNRLAGCVGAVRTRCSSGFVGSRRGQFHPIHDWPGRIRIGATDMPRGGPQRRREVTPADDKHGDVIGELNSQEIQVRTSTGPNLGP